MDILRKKMTITPMPILMKNLARVFFLKKHRPLLMGFFFLFASFLLVKPEISLSFSPPKDDGIKISILFFNDLHGHLRPYKIKTAEGKKEVGGLARIAALIKDIRQQNARDGIKTFVFIAGDILQGTPMSTVFKGKADFECLNAMSIDAMTIGNHEFDFGLKNFLDLQKMANFPLLSSNIIWADSKELIASPLAVFKINDKLSLTVIGATTNELLTTTKPDNVRKLAVLDSVETVKKSFDLHKKSGPVILLSHSKFETDKVLAESLPGLTAIIGGHDQVLFEPFRKIGEVGIFQAHEKGKYLGRINFSIDPSTQKASLIDAEYIPISPTIINDPEINQIIQSYYEKIEKKMRTVIGYATVFLDGERKNVRFNESNLGNLITDIMLKYSGAQLALINGGSIRSSIDAGKVTMGDVVTAMPFANELVTLELTGEEIYRCLLRSVQGTQQDEDGGFLQVAGLKFNIKDGKPENIIIGNDRAKLDKEKKYLTAITDFLYAGGDGYTLFKGKAAKKTGLPLRELIVSDIRDRGNISAEVEGRIVRE